MITKKGWLKWHKILALSVGWLFLLQASTGAFLAVEADIDGALHPHLLLPELAPGPVTFGEAYVAAQDHYPDHRVIFVQEPTAHHSVYEVVLDGITGKRVYVNSHTGTVTGERGAFTIPKNIALILHTGILGGDWLESAFGISGIIVSVVMLSGLLAWWPKLWRSAWVLSFKSPLAFLITSHRILGAVLILILIPIVISGVLLSFHETTKHVFYWVSGTKPPLDSVSPSLENRALQHYTAEQVNHMITVASERLGGQQAHFIVFPRKPNHTISIRLKNNNSLSESGRSRAWFDPATLELLGSVNADHAVTTQTLLDAIYPLHSGRIQGLSLSLAWFLLGCLSCVLSVGGYCLWWYKRKSRYRRF